MTERRPLIVPRVNANDETVVLARWIVAYAEWVEAGAVIAEIETSKAIVEVAAEAAGFLQWGPPEGGRVSVGDPLGWLTPRPPSSAAPLKAAPESERPGERLISGVAAALMREHGLTAADLPGAGPIRRSNVESVIAARATAPVDCDAVIAALPVTDFATLIFGADAQGTVVHDCLELVRPGSVVIFVDDAPRRTHLMGVPVLPAAALPAIRAHGIRLAHVSVASPAAKLACAERLVAAGYEIVQVRHPTASVARSAKIGTGVFLGPLTLVGPEATVHDYVQINNCSSVAHHCIVGRAARLSDGVRLAGSAVIEEGAFLGLAVTVNEKITIGRGSTVVSGVHVFDHVPPRSIVRVDGKSYPMRGAS